MEVMESIIIIHRLLQITCLTQLHYQKGSKLLEQNKLLLLYSTTVVLISIAILIYGLFDRTPYIQEGYNYVGNTVDYIQLLGIRIAHIVSTIESILRHDIERILFKKFQDIDDIFEKSLHENLHKKTFRTKMLWRCLGICCLFLGSELFLLGVLFISSDSMNFGYWISYLMPLMIVGLRNYQVYVIVYMVKDRFNMVNQYLNTIKFSAKNHLKDMTTKRKFSGNLIQPLEIFETGQRFQRIATESTITTTTTLAQNRLLIFRDIYNRLWEITTLINTCYGISLLINIGNDFVSITSNCYWMFLRFKQAPNNFSEIIKTIGSAVWSIPHLFNILIVTAICHWTVQSAKKTSVMVHKIEIDAINHNLNTFIEQFSLQLLHQKVKFTAFGFFNIDFTLLYTIAGATTTYLIILIQFHMNEQKNSSLTTEKVSPAD